MPRTKRILSTAGVLVVMLFGAISIDRSAGEDDRRQEATSEWPSTPGRIVSSRVAKYKAKRTTSYRPVIDYTYTVDGTTYQSSRYKIVTITSEDEATAIVARFQVGHSHQVGTNQMTTTRS
jgi:hypothetical protein